MAIYKRGNIYWYKFRWNGELVRESTKQSNNQIARNMESAHRTALANGLVGIREKKQAPKLSDFLKNDFEPYTTSKHTDKPRTAEYYSDGAAMIKKCDFASLAIDKITDQHAQQFAAKFNKLSASRINCGLRTLRRSLNLAYEWGMLEKPAKIAILKGERQRDRVLTDAELDKYIAACPQPWRDAATLIVGTGMRPGEVFPLRWERIYLDDRGGLIQVAEGKTKAAKRLLPMVPAVHDALRSRWLKANKPTEGWVFPSGSEDGHFNGDTSKDQHAVALERSKVKRFEPYVLRHTALTRLAEKGCDAFTLARIAGHSSITITQRYIHPQADAIDRAFASLTQKTVQALPEKSENSEVGTNLGTTPVEARAV